MNALNLISKPNRGFRSLQRLQQTMWSSALYRHGYRIGAAVTRPFRRFEIATIYRQDLTGRVDLYDADIVVNIGQGSAEEVERAAETLRHRDPRRRDLFRWRLENGCRCFVARMDSALVGYEWVRLRRGHDDGDTIALAEREAFDFDLYVDEKWRGHKIQTALGSRMRLFCKQQGYTTIYTKVSVINRRSLKGMNRTPWKPSGAVLRVRASKRGGWPIVTLWGSSHPLSRLRKEDAIALGRQT